jgi:hypothetical protein
MEARTHIRCTLALLGALCGTEHPIPTEWCTMMMQYERVEARLQHEIDTEVGSCMCHSLFVFHLQLILRDWFVEQTRTGQRTTVAAPDFGQYLKVFERQNNLHWLLSLAKIPPLLVFLVAAAALAHPLGPAATPTQEEPHIRPNVWNWFP